MWKELLFISLKPGGITITGPGEQVGRQCHSCVTLSGISYQRRQSSSEEDGNDIWLGGLPCCLQSSLVAAHLLIGEPCLSTRKILWSPNGKFFEGNLFLGPLKSQYIKTLPILNKYHQHSYFLKTFEYIHSILVI